MNEFERSEEKLRVGLYHGFGPDEMYSEKVMDKPPSISELKRYNASLKRSLRKEQNKTKKRAKLRAENDELLAKILILKENAR
jgi:hypothetical protein